jgi:hypothetical protein
MCTKNTLFFIVMSAVVLNSCFAYETRLWSMGDLRYIFQDEYNELNLFDFANMPAGFFEDDTFSVFSFTAAGLKQKWQEDSVIYWAIGQAFPENLRDYAPFEALGPAGFEDIPVFSLPPCQFRYESRRFDTEYGFFGEELKPQSWGIIMSYSQLSRDYMDTLPHDLVRMPELYIIWAKPLADNFNLGVQCDGFYGTFRSSDEDDRASFFPIGGATGISYNAGSVIFGLNCEYHYTMFTYTHTLGETDYSQNFTGHAVSPSLAGIITLGNLVWANVLGYRYVNLAGSYAEYDLGNVILNDYSAKSHVLYRHNIFRFTLAGLIDAKTPTYIDDNDFTEFETTYIDYAGIIGAGIELPKLKAGVEGEYVSARAEDNIYDVTMSSRRYTVRVGGEFAVSNNFFVRAGYNYEQQDPDVDVTDDRIRMHTVMTGIGFYFAELLKLDLAYNYKLIKLEDNTSERIIDHAVLFYLKRLLR